MARIDRVEVVVKRVPGQLRDLSRHLGPGGSGADHHKRQPGLAPRWVRFGLGCLKRGEDPPSDRQRALQRLDLEREAPPLVVPEVGVARAAGDNQRVVLDRYVSIAFGKRIEHNLVAIEVKPAHLTHHDADVALALEDRPQRRGDLLR